MKDAIAGNFKDFIFIQRRLSDKEKSQTIWKRGILRCITITILFILAFAFTEDHAYAFQGYNVVTTTDAATETTFLSATTAQFAANVIINPFVPGTYQINLFGPNPLFNPLPTTLQQALSLGSTVYAYGWASGVNYQQTQEESFIGAMGNLCGSATNYNLTQTNSSTFDNATCQDVIGTIENQLFEESLSTVPVLGF
jgi:hypothetical protein